jgi:TetR/AcrR family transcriptional regulator, transcriptional repressor for nem operon
MKKNTKEKLIKAGITAMLEKSYHSVGIKEILDSVGVPKGSFYYYFKSKEEFGIEIIDSFAHDHAATIQSFLEDRSKSPLERLKGSFVSCLNYYPEKGHGNNCLIAKLSHEVMNDSPNMCAAIRSAFDMWQSLYARMIREAQNCGEIDPDLDPEELAAFIHNSWEGAVMMMQVYKNYDPVKNYIHFVFEELLKSKVNFDIKS